MSQMTASAPRYAPDPTRARGRRVSGATPLRVVHAAPKTVTHVWFAMMLGALIIGGLLVMLMLNMARAEGSFVLSDLRSEHATLEAERATLESELADASSPASLAKKAESLGMVASPSTATVRLSDHAVSGVAAVVEDGKTFTVDLPGADSAGGSQQPGE
ncbi:MAG: hypothetical protein WBG89_10560 [Ornithinimicrobium sp.]